MNNSKKNELQEYCQRNAIELPKYKSSRIDNDRDHEPIWQCEIVFNNKSYRTVSGTKKGAEVKIAEMIIGELQPKQQITTIIKKQKIDDILKIDFSRYIRIILIDGENVDILENNFKETDLILIFVAKNATKNNVFKLQTQLDNCFVIISDSIARDAADTLLIFTAGRLAVKLSDRQFVIITKDHFGESLQKCLDNCKHICSTQDL